MARSDTAKQEEDDVLTHKRRGERPLSTRVDTFLPMFSFGFVAQAQIVLRALSCTFDDE
jgi:hypothetical protein